MAKLPHTSRHRIGKNLVEVPRRFDESHLESGYHTQELGEASTPDHEIHGVYATVRGDMTVSHVEGEPVGLLNRIFGYAYQIRLAGKRLKAKSQIAYYAVKYVLMGALFYWIFLS